jgi:SPP1 family phage portal protein
MNISDILAIGNWDAILTELKQDPFSERVALQENIDYYNNKHPILTDPSRADYTITKTADDGTVKTELVKRSKIVLPIPRQIVETGASMLFGEPVDLTLNDDKTEELKEAFEFFVDVWKRGDFDTFNHQLFTAISVESKAAELLYVSDLEAESKEDTALSIKPMLFRFDLGDELYPHFNDSRELDALTRVYKKRIYTEGAFTDVEVTEIYTSEGVYVRNGLEGAFELQALPYEMLPVIYYDQLYSEWHWVKELIDKQELIASQFSDVNKRIGNPFLAIKGKVKQMPDVGADVKIFTVEADKSLSGNSSYGSVELVESKAANESIKQEQERLDEMIYKNTWPDFNRLMEESATGNISIATMKLKFLNAFVRMGEKRPLYMKGLKARIELLKQMLYKITGKQEFLSLDISIKFNSVLPDNIREIIENIAESINAGTLSRKSGVYLDPHNKGNEQTVLDEIETEEGLQAGRLEV